MRSSLWDGMQASSLRSSTHLCMRNEVSADSVRSVSLASGLESRVREFPWTVRTGSRFGQIESSLDPSVVLRRFRTIWGVNCFPVWLVRFSAFSVRAMTE